MSQAVDPEVSRAKFEREVAEYRSMEDTFVKRGWWLMQAAFPIVKVAYLTTKTRPSMLALAVRVDFNDYDLRPPSVKFVDPFDDRELGFHELLTKLPRLEPAMTDEAVAAAKAGVGSVSIQMLIQGYPGLPGFLCLPGIREYHDNPGHTGDAWLLHRDKGDGRLFNILDVIWRYGSNQLDAVGFAMMLQQSDYPR